MFAYRKILVPLDGSKLAGRALFPAVTLARSMAAQLFLLRVIPPLTLTIDPQFHTQLSQQGMDEANAYLRRVLAELSSPPIKVSMTTLCGPAAGSIIQFAQEQEIDLIVMSSHGRSGASRWVYGSVAEKVLRGANCNTVIIRAQTEVEPFTYKRILTPLDGSELAEKALPPALAIARAIKAELVLLRVVKPAHLAIETQTMQQQSDYLESQEQQEAEAYLQQVAAPLKGDEVAVVSAIIKGPIADSIIDYAEAHHVDLITMSSHGRSGIGRWLYGSVTEKVLRGANCATLVIREASQL